MRARRTRIWAAASTCLALGCAEIRSSTTVDLVPKPDAEARILGSPTGAVAKRGFEASWTQTLDALEIELVELQQCETLLHEPVVRVERTRRRAGMALYWEWGLGGALAGLGIAGLATPAFLSNTYENEEGEFEKDLTSGRRLAGISLGVGTIMLIAGVVDLVRARDEVRYADAYRIAPGDPVACPEPSVAIAHRPVTLLVDDWRAEGHTDADGRAQLLLPREPVLTTRDRTLRHGVVRFADDRAVTIDYVTPYALTVEDPHRGRTVAAPH